MYDPKSMKAEEFINHEEILDTLKYAEENKHNKELIASLIEKARLCKARPQGSGGIARVRYRRA